MTCLFRSVPAFTQYGLILIASDVGRFGEPSIAERAAAELLKMGLIIGVASKHLQNMAADQRLTHVSLNIKSVKHSRWRQNK